MAVKRRPGPLKVLVVEDDPLQAELLTETLSVDQNEFVFERAPTLGAAMAAVRAAPFDVVVLDLGLPDSVGLATVRTFMAAGFDLPVVVFSNDGDMRTAKAAMEEGAQDYLVKGGASVHRYARVLVQAHERHAVQHALRQRTEDVKAFTYALTHDLKSPLVTLDYLIDDAREILADIVSGASDEEISPAQFRNELELLVQNLERSHTAVTRMSHNIEDILAFGRIDSDEDGACILALDAVVRGAVEAQRDYAQSRGCTITVGALPRIGVLADPVKVNHLLINLLSNAIKYGPEQGGKVDVSADPDGRWLRIADNGPGVSDAEKTDIFKPFVRGSAAIGGQPGTGLGLATARRAAEAMDARLWVEDAAPTGASFVVEFPRALVRAPTGESVRVNA